MGGAGAAVAEALAAEGIVKPLLMLGLPDQFIDHGDPARCWRPWAWMRTASPRRSASASAAASRGWWSTTPEAERAMDELWRRFEAWLAEHWPKGLESLNPPLPTPRLPRSKRVWASSSLQTTSPA